MHYEARLLATAAVWTPARLADVEYITGAQCQFCGERDTVFHRFWQCPEVAAARLEVTSSRIIQNVIEEAYEDGAGLEYHEVHVAATRALVPRPEPPPMSTSDDFLFQTYQEGQWVAHDPPTFSFDVDRPIFTDGACGQHAVRAIWRAGCSAVQTTDS